MLDHGLLLCCLLLCCLLLLLLLLVFHGGRGGATSAHGIAVLSDRVASRRLDVGSGDCRSDVLPH